MGGDKGRILLIGDAFSRVCITGDVSRLSPEAPVPVIRSGNVRHSEGGVRQLDGLLKPMGVSPVVRGVDMGGVEMFIYNQYGVGIIHVLDVKRCDEAPNNGYGELVGDNEGCYLDEDRFDVVVVVDYGFGAFGSSYIPRPSLSLRQVFDAARYVVAIAADPNSALFSLSHLISIGFSLCDRTLGRHALLFSGGYLRDNEFGIVGDQAYLYTAVAKVAAAASSCDGFGLSDARSIIFPADASRRCGSSRAPVLE